MTKRKRQKRTKRLYELGAKRERERIARAGPSASSSPWAVVRRLVAVVLMATFLGSLVAYFIPPFGKLRHPGIPAWRQTHAHRLGNVVRLWGWSRDRKRESAPSDFMGGDVFRFTRFWGGILDERLMPQTKCWDHTRQEHIRYLLPNTGRRSIPPPPGLDKRPPVVVGYDLPPERLAMGPLRGQTEHSGTIALDEGRRLGQSFVTDLDYDVIDAVAFLAPLEAALPTEGYDVVLYSKLDRQRVLARTATAEFQEHEGMKVAVFFFEPRPRLRYNRGARPYLVEVTWQRPEGYDGPAPVFAYADGNTYAGGEMQVDGVEWRKRDLAFGVQATHTDVHGYALVFAIGKPGKDGEWPRYFFAVRQDVLDMTGLPGPGESEAQFLERLNKVLLEL